MKVFVTRKLPGDALEKLKKEFELIVREKDSIPTEEEIIEGIKGCVGLLCLLTDQITRKVIENSELKVISNYAVGYDNIDIEAANERGIMVTNTPDVLTNATAELTWALILSVARHIVSADNFLRKGKFTCWSPTLFLGIELSGKTLGILGAGRIGTAVALKSKAYDMSILYTDLCENKLIEKKVNAKRVELNELFSKSDIVTIHLPLNRKTYKIIGKKELSLMKPTAILINTSRGKIIDENALIEILEDGKIFGAGLDVYENEPFVPDRLKKLENVVLLPHIGSATFTARINMANLAVENLIIGLKGGTPPNLVNK